MRARARERRSAEKVLQIEFSYTTVTTAITTTTTTG